MKKQFEKDVPYLTDDRFLDGILNDNSYDPLGSYTGRTPDRYEKPVQDADDL